MSDKPNTPGNPGSTDEQQDALVKSLESIKELLAKSESKLNAARDSLSKTNLDMNKAKPSASPTTASKTVKGKIPVSSDPVVPVLDDIVEAEVNEPQLDISSIEVVGEETPYEEVSEASGEIPVFEFGSNPGANTGNIDTDAVQDFIDQMHESLEQHIHHTLKHVTEQIEADLKRALNEQIAKLRKQF